jgi:Arc/MetJ family transcription regulator
VYVEDEILHTGLTVRTNIEIDDELMARAMELSGLRTKRAVVEAGLRALIERRSRQLLRESFGKYPWEGDLDQMRGRIKRNST